MWREIKKVIHHHHDFILTTHVNPDGDGIGAACALTELLMQMQKKSPLCMRQPYSKEICFFRLSCRT